MNALIENNCIREMDCGSNFAYILCDNSSFLSTEYKVLQSQTNSCFVRCMKMMYNGHVQLYYLTKGLKSFASMIPSMDAESFLTIVSNLLADIIDVKHNGFLACWNIDSAFERIYVDPATYKVSLVYLPLSKRIFEDNASFENEIRTSLVKLISGVSTISSPQTAQLAEDLCDGTLSMEALSARLKSGKNKSAPQKEAEREQASSDVLRMIALNAPRSVEFTITKDDFVIGKKQEFCDAVIDFNQSVSRLHCRISRNGNQYTITDLQSANGTYVNKIRLRPNQPHSIKNGDVVRLANSDFRIKIG